MKLVPVRVMVNPGSPAVAVLGVMLLRLGTGFGSIGADPIVKIWADEVPPPGAGLNTVTVAVPEEIKSLDEMLAVRLVGLR